MNNIWASLKEALHGSRRDHTEGSLSKAITMLAIPMVLEMIMESLFAVVDVFWVSRLGSDAVATVGLTEGLLTTVFAIAMGLAFSTTAFVARRIGEKDTAGAVKAAVQAIFLGFVVSLLIGACGIIYGRDLLQLMGAEPGVLANFRYTQIILGGSIVVMYLFLLNAVFRGAGDAAIAMRVLWMANIINMVLNPFLIFGIGPFPRMGVLGSAVGTTIGRGIGVAYQFWCLTRGSSRIHITFSQFQIDWPLMGRLFRISLNGMLQIFVATASWTAMARIAATFGSAALAGYTLAVRVIIFSILPSWGLCNAAATLVGQCLGAKKPERAVQSVWTAGKFNSVYLSGLAVIYIIFAERILGIFSDDARVIAIGADCLRFVTFSYPLVGFGMTMMQAFNGAGDTRTPTMVNFVAFWVFQIPLAWGLSKYTGLQERGLFVAIFVAQCAIALLSIYLFKRGRWQTQRI